ncbi:MAG: hypothetical protein OSB05_00665 [Akkermansiaceae bacterium]|nr:hypothetical protein [Akkermansiaceae bacterium]
MAPNRSPITQDKSQYHLFNPTPDDLLRKISPGRLDATESPITVDAGLNSKDFGFFTDFTKRF